MDNKIEVFKNEQFGEVRTILDGETLLFCGSDVARALGYARPGKAIIDHCKGVLKRDTLTSGGTQSLSYITEGDVYRLVITTLNIAQKLLPFFSVPAYYGRFLGLFVLLAISWRTFLAHEWQKLRLFCLRFLLR